MQAASISAFRLKSATVQNSAHGVAVTFRGESVNVILSPIRTSLDLESGGLKAGGEHTCRLLATTIAKAPTRGEQMQFNGRKYTITEVKDTISTPGEYVVILEAGSKL
jgi:hypothetical protein